ncbi:MAG: cytochrome c-type biogenesis protein CcmH [Chloroflexi bacterium]|nr:cytochrome c-type biogenesis protein CcmH [Chloroflexota bacterium]
MPRLIVRLLLLLAVILSVQPAWAQQDPPPRPVTDDEVNAIANKLYCPVCENITLDVCPTTACMDWRMEIRLMLEQGMSEQQIIDDFVRRFGDRVVGTPQDPTLRALSLYTPWILSGLGLLVALGLVIRWRMKRLDPAESLPPQTSSRYRDQLEQDLAG